MILLLWVKSERKTLSKFVSSIAVAVVLGGDLAVCDMYRGVGVNLGDNGLNIVMIVCRYFSEV